MKLDNHSTESETITKLKLFATGLLLKNNMENLEPCSHDFVIQKRKHEKRILKSFDAVEVASVCRLCKFVRVH